ncbi:MAG: cyclic nucleotide-binding domain-containing protein [Candidatus Omnitrophica bacterium]|nr:cyclic nucleotide-binding domain-containing protein [Candidatus Omnitrophota bacterium]
MAMCMVRATAMNAAGRAVVKLMEKVYYPLIAIDEVSALLNKISVFGSLNNSQLQEVFKLLKTVKYGEGEFIYKRGDASSYIYIIKQGEVKMVIDNEDVFLELISFRQGDCFGETSVIGIQSHSSSALAVKPTELIVLEPGSLLSIFETDPEVFGILILNIARETARRLRQSNEALVQYMIMKNKKVGGIG